MTDTSTPGALVCPKCQGTMRSYERSGVTIDQCTECRGVFLDRGELERLAEAEDVHYADAARRPGPAYAEPAPSYASEWGRSGHHGGGHHGGGYGRRGKRRGFLGELFD